MNDCIDSSGTNADGGIAARSVGASAPAIILFQCDKYASVMTGAIEVVP